MLLYFAAVRDPLIANLQSNLIRCAASRLVSAAARLPCDDRGTRWGHAEVIGNGVNALVVPAWKPDRGRLPQVMVGLSVADGQPAPAALLLLRVQDQPITKTAPRTGPCPTQCRHVEVVRVVGEDVAMTLVEWTALGGDQVETLLANLIYNHEGRALRVRPSQGDYGLDIIIPAANPEKWDVYQVKKFATNLTASQKGQIEKSFRSVLVGMVRRGVPLNDWYLTLPLDPTPENLLDWFKGMPGAGRGSPADTKLKLTDSEFNQIEAWLHAPDRSDPLEGPAVLREPRGEVSLRRRLLPPRRA